MSESASTPDRHQSDAAAYPPPDSEPAPSYLPPDGEPTPGYPPPGAEPAVSYPPPTGEPLGYAYSLPAPAPWYRRPTQWRPSRAEIRWAVLVVLVLAVVGFGVAAVWLNLAPRLPFRVTKPGEAEPTLPEYETFIGDDGWFFVSTLVVGLVAGVLAFLPKAGRGALMTLALGVGGLAGSLITWRTGQYFAPRPTHDMLQHVGDTVLYPVTLGATAFLVAEPFAAVVLYVIIAGFVANDDLDNPADLAAAPKPAPHPAAS